MDRLATIYHVLDTNTPQQAFWDWARQHVANDHLFFVLGLFLSHTVTFFAMQAIFGLLTRSRGPAIEEIRFCPNKNPSKELVRKCIIYVSVFHALAPILPATLYHKAVARQPGLITDPVPGILTLLWQLPLCYLSTDFFFYWGHRALHIPFLYRWIHKQHHQFYVTIGFAAEYAHPIELLLGNIWPVLSAPILFRMHFFTFCVWNAIALFGTSLGHSGLHLLSNSGFHDFHHSTNIGNYGSLPVWDWICGTDAGWKEHKAKLKRRWAEQEKARALQSKPLKID